MYNFSLNVFTNKLPPYILLLSFVKIRKTLPCSAWLISSFIIVSEICHIIVMATPDSVRSYAARVSRIPCGFEIYAIWPGLCSILFIILYSPGRCPQGERCTSKSKSDSWPRVRQNLLMVNRKRSYRPKKWLLSVRLMQLIINYLSYLQNLWDTIDMVQICRQF